MVIGVDIDDTVADFRRATENIANEYDKKLRNTGQVNKELWITKGRYDWSYEEIKKFENFAFEEIIDKLEVLEDSKKYLNELKDMGDKIIFITKRSKTYYKTPYESSKKWLDKNGFKYDKLIIEAGDEMKAKICKQEKVDFFIDDRMNICKLVKQSGIKSFMLVNDYNKKYLNNKDKDLDVVYSFKEFFDIIMQEKNK